MNNLNLNESFYPLNVELSTFNENIMIDSDGTVMIDPSIIENSERYYEVALSNYIEIFNEFSENPELIGLSAEKYAEVAERLARLQEILSKRSESELTASIDDSSFGGNGLKARSKLSDSYSKYKALIKNGMAIGKRIKSDYKSTLKQQKKTESSLSENQDKWSKADTDKPCCKSMDAFEEKVDAFEEIVDCADDVLGVNDGYNGTKNLLDELESDYKDWKQDGMDDYELTSPVEPYHETMEDDKTAFKDCLREFKTFHEDKDHSLDSRSIDYVISPDGDTETIEATVGHYVENPPEDPQSSEEEKEYGGFVSWDSPSYIKDQVVPSDKETLDSGYSFYPTLRVESIWKIRAKIDFYKKDGNAEETFWKTRYTDYIEYRSDSDNDYFEILEEKAEQLANAICPDGYAVFEAYKVDNNDLHFKVVFCRGFIKVSYAYPWSTSKPGDYPYSGFKAYFLGDKTDLPGNDYDIETDSNCAKSVSSSVEGVYYAVGYSDDCLTFLSGYTAGQLDNKEHIVKPMSKWRVDIYHDRDYFSKPEHYSETINEVYKTVEKDWSEANNSENSGSRRWTTYLNYETVYGELSDAYGSDHELDKSDLKTACAGINRVLNNEWFLDSSDPPKFDLYYECKHDSTRFELSIDYVIDPSVDAEDAATIRSNYQNHPTYWRYPLPTFYGKACELSDDIVAYYNDISTNATNNYDSIDIEGKTFSTMSELVENNMKFTAVRTHHAVSSLHTDVFEETLAGEAKFYIDEDDIGTPGTEYDVRSTTAIGTSTTTHVGDTIISSTEMEWGEGDFPYITTPEIPEEYQSVVIDGITVLSGACWEYYNGENSGTKVGPGERIRIDYADVGGGWANPDYCGQFGPGGGSGQGQATVTTFVLSYNWQAE